MSRHVAPTRFLESLPNEILARILAEVNILDDDAPSLGIVLANKHLHAMAKRQEAQDVSIRLQRDFDPALVAESPWLDTRLLPRHRLRRIALRAHDREHLYLLVQGFVRVCGDNIAPLWVLGFSCGTVAAYFVDLRDLLAKVPEMDPLAALQLLESEGMHYQQFASVRQIANAIARWSDVEILQLRLLSQMLGRMLFFLRCQRDIFPTVAQELTYVQVAELMLLLAGSRPILSAIMEGIRMDKDERISGDLLEALPSERCTRDAREPAHIITDVPAWLRQWVRPSGNFTVDAAIKHIQDTNSFIFLQDQNCTFLAGYYGHLPIGQDDDYLVGEKELEDMVRLDMLVEARLATIMHVDVKSRLSRPEEILKALSKKLRNARPDA